jgi:hypothetical protein
MVRYSKAAKAINSNDMMNIKANMVPLAIFKEDNNMKK